MEFDALRQNTPSTSGWGLNRLFWYQGEAWYRIEVGAEVMYVSPTRIYRPEDGVMTQRDLIPRVVDQYAPYGGRVTEGLDPRGLYTETALQSAVDSFITGRSLLGAWDTFQFANKDETATPLTEEQKKKLTAHIAAYRDGDPECGCCDVKQMKDFKEKYEKFRLEYAASLRQGGDKGKEALEKLETSIGRSGYQLGTTRLHYTGGQTVSVNYNAAGGNLCLVHCAMRHEAIHNLQLAEKRIWWTGAGTLMGGILGLYLRHKTKGAAVATAEHAKKKAILGVTKKAATRALTQKGTAAVAAAGKTAAKRVMGIWTAIGAVTAGSSAFVLALRDHVASKAENELGAFADTLKCLANYIKACDKKQ